MKIAASLFMFIIFCALLSISADATYNLENGFKHWRSFEGSNLDTINNLNGNQMLVTPV